MPNCNVGEVAAFPGLPKSLIYCTELQQGDGFGATLLSSFVHWNYMHKSRVV